MFESREPFLYLAAPFFNEEQIALVDKLEDLIESVGYELFSPRKGENAIEMNKKILEWQEWDARRLFFLQRNTCGNKYKDPQPSQPSEELRLRVFTDNVVNIDNADLVVAVIDDFDSGVLFELGYAYARHVPILTITNHAYGCNLMLAHSVIGHLKSLEELQEALLIGFPRLALGDSKMEDYGSAIAEIQYKFKCKESLVEGPLERT